MPGSCASGLFSRATCTASRQVANLGRACGQSTANSYSSVGKFRFTASGAEARLLDPTRSTELSQETIGAGALHILNSDEPLLRVIKKLGPGRILAPFQPDAGDEGGARAWLYRFQRDWNATDAEPTEIEALKFLRRAIAIDIPRGSPILIVTCTANGPVLAQEILDTYMTEAVQWHLEQYDDTRVYEDRKRAHEEAQIALNKARLAMREFLSTKAKVPDFEVEKRQLEQQDINAINSLAEVQQEGESTRSALAAIRQQISGPDAVPKTVVQKKRLDATSETRRLLQQQQAN